MKPIYRRWVGGWIVALWAISGSGLGAAELINGLGGPRDYGTGFLDRNDDDSTASLPLPFALNFYGNAFSSFYLNNNGNITFTAPLSTFTPTQFPVGTTQTGPIIAPWWGDVDTRNNPGDGSNLAYWAAPDTNTLVVTWDTVGFFSSNNSLRNDFQLVLRNRSETGAGNFDIEFRYRTLQWTTGDASEGTNGLGGIPAQAGYDAGDGLNFLVLPGSFSGLVLDLATTSNVSTDTPGLWQFAVRNGRPPGADPTNPLLGVPGSAGLSFDFNVLPNTPIYIGAGIAVGYDFLVTDGPGITSLFLPEGFGDDLYTLWLWVEEAQAYLEAAEALAGGEEHLLASPLTRFRLTGVELPDGDITQFIAGLEFEGQGAVSLGLTVIPESETWAMLALAGAMFAGWASRRRGLRL